VSGFGYKEMQKREAVDAGILKEKNFHLVAWEGTQLHPPRSKEDAMPFIKEKMLGGGRSVIPS